MNLTQLDFYLNSFLHRENYSSDPSLNGIQIQNENPNKQIKKIAFAVDACEASAKIAAEKNADVLFVHHGIFWGHCETLTGSFYKRASKFIRNNLALIAYHIPLDANSEVGNNYGMARKLGMTELKDFGYWKGMTIGVKGELKTPLSIKELSEKISRPGHKAPVILDFGKKEISTVGIISGGGSEDIEQAVAENLDAYITGAFAHEQFHYAQEMQINVIGGGHYETETIGVNLVKEKIDRELGTTENIETFFIDLPTEL